MSGFAERKLKPARAPDALAADRPIDLVHLSRQSLGDRALERELLQLFDRQAEQIIARLASEIGAGDRRWRRDLSHTLAGSAKAVGALRVGHAASVYEEALFSSASDRELKVLRDALSGEVAAARTAIAELLADG
ncbi:MAG: Hpt domain-containing protein [Beijerinckiaceae bacterium]|nr:Hpt domain-containing protein [Beijerinckiaceae bacterium]